MKQVYYKWSRLAIAVFILATLISAVPTRSAADQSDERLNGLFDPLKATDLSKVWRMKKTSRSITNRAPGGNFHADSGVVVHKGFAYIVVYIDQHPEAGRTAVKGIQIVDDVMEAYAKRKR